MKKLTLLLSVAIAMFASCNNAPETTDAAKPADSVAAEAPAPPPAIDSATAAKNMEEYMTLGEMHKVLAMGLGTWNTEMTGWWEEGKPPMVTKGTCEFKMIMGGRYKQSTFKGDMMGMPFEGMGITAYDNAAKVFVDTWIDNMGTGIMTMQGSYDAAAKTIESKGTCMDPVARVEKTMRSVMKMVDDKNMVMEMYETLKGGTERKTMEIKYAKK